MKKTTSVFLSTLLSFAAQAQTGSEKSINEANKWQNQQQRADQQRRDQNNKQVDRQIQNQRYEQSRPRTPPPPPRYNPPPPPRQTDYKKR